MIDRGTLIASVKPVGFCGFGGGCRCVFLSATLGWAQRWGLDVVPCVSAGLPFAEHIVCVLDAVRAGPALSPGQSAQDAPRNHAV